jgi:hypothetical protein
MRLGDWPEQYGDPNQERLRGSPIPGSVRRCEGTEGQHAQVEQVSCDQQVDH